MNYHAKSGAYRLKIDWVMLNLVFGGHFSVGGHFVFWYFYRWLIWTSVPNFRLLACKLTDLCPIAPQPSEGVNDEPRYKAVFTVKSITTVKTKSSRILDKYLFNI